jgi:hypothetical protein
VRKLADRVRNHAPRDLHRYVRARQDDGRAPTLAWRLQAFWVRERGPAEQHAIKALGARLNSVAASVADTSPGFVYVLTLLDERVGRFLESAATLREQYVAKEELVLPARHADWKGL